MAETSKGVIPVDAATVKDWLAKDECVLVDVREPGEYAAGHVPGSISVPLSRFSTEGWPSLADKKLVLHCQAGGRATDAANRLLKSGADHVYCFAGGMGEWRAKGYDVVQAQAAGESDGVACAAAPGRGLGMTVQQQTLLTIGLMVLLFTLLSIPWPGAKWLNLIPALGLINAGVTGLCPLAMLIAKAPWNR